jgi:protein subunit release factor A
MEINKKDIKVHYSRGHGPGGQHKNKTESCVTITHIPTGITETCQETRSQKKNYDIAIARIERKLLEIDLSEKTEKINEERKTQILNKKHIRTYNYPRGRVKDHRSGKEADLKKFLDGDLELLR